MKSIVAIVGRPNVGKSTLFNRLTKSRKAIVDEYSGVTRDRHYGTCDWNGREFEVIDTGGYVENSDDIFEKEIKKQVLLAIEEADVILFMVDVMIGITDLDLQVARMLKKVNKKVIHVVNKTDNNESLYDANEFYKLGLGEIFPLCSLTGSGTGELLDAVISKLPAIEAGSEEDAENIPKFAIIGRPNVGKSTLINALIGAERNIVTAIPGTTRDTIFTRYTKYNHDFYLVDTAGIRKKTKVTQNIEFYSVMRSLKTIENSDVCILLIDATTGLESQDANIYHLVARNHKGIVLLVNKWDLVKKEKNITEKYTALIKEKLAPFNDVPIIYISALTKQRIFKVIEAAMEVYTNRTQKIATSKLNVFLEETIAAYSPPMVKGKIVSIKYGTQLPTHAPSFAFYCNHPQYLKEEYKRYIENRLREKFNFTGVPIKIFFRQK